MDITVSKNVLQLVASFADDDDRTFTVENPAASITAGDSVASAAVQDLNSYILNNSILIGATNGSACTGIKSAKVLGRTTTDYDLS